MLHDNLITENFLHHVQKEQSVSPPTSSSPSAKINLYDSFHYKQMQNQLLYQRNQQQQQLQNHYQHQQSQQEDERVLDLSRRNDFQTTHILSPINNERKFSSPPSTTEVNRKSESPIQRPEISASLLAENLQKFYNQQHLLKVNSVSNQTNILHFPQPIDNLFTQNDLSLKNTAYPSPQQKLGSSNMLSNISPKSGLKSDLTDTDRLSDTSSVPGSPSSSTSIIYPKLLNPAVIQNSNNDLTSINKPTRPFKAFPRDPLVIAANFAATDVLYDNPRVERYTEYRKRVLEQIRSANGGERTISNPKMRRLNTRNNFNNNNSTNISSDGSYSDSQVNNSENEERANDSSSDNDTMVQSTTNFEINSDNSNHNNSSTKKINIKSSNIKNKDLNENPNNLLNNNGIIKDAAYYERRRKNNAAAKKSRDRRRIKEDEIAIRAAYLERQNIELLCQLDALKAQLAALTKAQTS
ncbi:protein giant [Condylostylus longicornis]|uniref:protein giant n=1 Tax=Condylostylus longicornis TaxID=2530218 RepID=UPI00244E4A05|nr:protein giant [Condylostylus longicornis]